MEQHTPNEKAGSDNWKDKLDDVDGLSSLLLQDKNAAWEKLHSRLHEKPAKKRFGWVWLAAACLLGLISLPFLLMDKKQDAVIIMNDAVTKNKIDGSSAIQQENTLVKTGIKHLKNKTAITPVKALNKEITVKKSAAAEPESIAMIKKDSVTPGSIQPLNIPIAVLLMATTTPEKKKLKVVHVNELGTPLPELRSRLADDDYSVIQFNVINQHLFNTTPSVGSKPSKPKNISN